MFNLAKYCIFAVLICFVMFWKNRIKEKRLEKLRDAAWDIVFKDKDELKDWAKSLDSTFSYDPFVSYLIDYYCAAFRFKNMGEDELINIGTVLSDKKEETRLKIYEYWKRGNENAKSLDDFAKNGMPLFVTMSSISDPSSNKVYALCYEFKKHDNDKYEAYVFTHNDKFGKTMHLCKYSYAFDKMTEEEFEKYYIVGRLERYGSCDEEDAIEYDNYLRRLFHGQREVI